MQAIILKQSLTTGSNSSYDHVINELTEVISNAQTLHKKGIKAQKVRVLLSNLNIYLCLILIISVEHSMLTFTFRRFTFCYLQYCFKFINKKSTHP